MPLFSWLFRSSRQALPVPAASSGLSRMEATRPSAPKGREIAASASNAQPANRKSERMVRRELLYGVVRDAMKRAGVPIPSYKFKVLSLDGRGRQFLVMVDLSRHQGSEMVKLAEVEALIAQHAKRRHDIVVTAVYWRTNEHVAIGDPALANPEDSQCMPLESIRSVPESASVQGATARAFDGSAKHGPQSYTLLTGFEDTEVPAAEQRAQVLSATQYGDLR